MIVQIYEIQDPWEAERCIELGVDHIGSVILSENAWKNPEIRKVVSLTHQISKSNSLIFLFQNLATIFKALEYYEPDIIHFCETLVDSKAKPLDISPFLRSQLEVKSRFPEIKVMRSIPIAPPDYRLKPPSLSLAKQLGEATDIFLTDTWLGEEPIAGFIGITGRPLDWEVAARLVRESRIPVILAGGLSPDNVYDALIKARPAGADSCTGTNKIDSQGRPIRFRKDFEKLRLFISEINRAQKELNSRLIGP